MTRQRRKDTLIYRTTDFFTALFAWACFFLYRKQIEGATLNVEIFQDLNFFYGIAIIPTTWVLFYSLFDDYRDIYRLSRLSTLSRTFFLTLFGVIILFFTLILDDVVTDFHTYYSSFFTLFILHFLTTSIVRMLLLTKAHARLKKGNVAFQTLLIGSQQRALELYQELTQKGENMGYQIIGYVSINEKSNTHLASLLPQLGTSQQLAKIIQQHNIEDIVIALEPSEQNTLSDIFDILYDFEDRIFIKIIPDMYDIVLGKVQMSQVYGAALIQVKQELMPKWERVAKRLIDLVVSVGVLLVFSPLYLYILLRVKWSSPGPIFYAQERIGFNGKPFHILKFRSMKVDAEAAGPQLSSENDPRITPWGLTMRKYRLDELPNFWNVLVGDMSLVGPRPERQFFINQIVQKAPHYKHLLKVRPGITSWGQVKYGYASNVDEMVQRLKFDILYIENMSLVLDLKIIIYTVLVIVQGRGK